MSDLKNDEKVVTEILESLRDPFKADGGDLVIEELDEEHLKVRIEIGPDGCAECVMSADVLEELLSSNIKRAVGRDVKVTVEDADRNNASNSCTVRR